MFTNFNDDDIIPLLSFIIACNVLVLKFNNSDVTFCSVLKEVLLAPSRYSNSKYLQGGYAVKKVGFAHTYFYN